MFLTDHLVQAYFLAIEKKTQGEKNSKLKKKTQNSSTKLNFSAYLKKCVNEFC